MLFFDEKETTTRSSAAAGEPFFIVSCQLRLADRTAAGGKNQTCVIDHGPRPTAEAVTEEVVAAPPRRLDYNG